MKIVLIGAGNVGYHLGKKLREIGEDVIFVFSRKWHNANKLASLINAKPSISLDQIPTYADLYIIAVHDDAILSTGEKLAAIGCRDKLVVHTAGATPISVFENTGLERYGTFYPLQTFSFGKEPDFQKIPICVDANEKADIDLLKKLALKISPNVHHFNDEQKAQIHVAAVFVNNFTNHLFSIADQILHERNVPFNILLPLIEETVEKIKNNDHVKMQTGPAVRGDEATIKCHLNLIKSNAIYKKIYQLMTESIQQSNTKN